MGEEVGRQEDEESGKEREDRCEVDNNGRLAWSGSRVHGKLELLYGS